VRIRCPDNSNARVTAGCVYQLMPCFLQRRESILPFLLAVGPVGLWAEGGPVVKGEAGARPGLFNANNPVINFGAAKAKRTIPLGGFV
jgi:hypothetical protein